MEKVIIGKRPQITLCLVAYLCEGHILLEDVPGVAKTMLARALARSVGCSFKRIQCTPDLLPTDVTGVSIFNQKTTEFEFRPGPIFAQTVLADEINRTTPRTQSALLEAMAERRVTADGQTYTLKPPFLVIATQNPDRPRGHLPAARGAARPLPDPPQPRLPEHRGGGEDARSACSTATPSTTSTRSCRRPSGSPARTRCARSTSMTRCAATCWRSSTARATHDDIQLGGSPRASIALFRTAQAHGGDQRPRRSSCPTTSSAWSSRCWRTASSCGPRAGCAR